MSVSSPGVSVLQYVYETEFDHNEAELARQDEIIPDIDITPRLEISAGTKYRVLRGKSPAACHNIVRTTCMISIMCRTEHKDLFMNVSDTKCANDYENMIELAGLNGSN